MSDDIDTQALKLPKAAVMRIIKSSLPENVRVSSEAATAISRAATVFTLFITQTANEQASVAKRKTVTAQDILEVALLSLVSNKHF